ncbi:hypothetical protein MBRA_01486 [Methylobacterium brachiatum]|nr:hypothetical protein MBRA_01486 [Methylobacterium brachiatum]
MNDTEPAVVLVRRFRASCERLYRAWTDPLMIQRWLAPGANVVEQAETDPGWVATSSCRPAGPTV